MENNFRENPLPNFPDVMYADISSGLEREFLSLESGYNTAKSHRQEWYRWYSFQQYNNEVKGKSTFVDSTIFNTVEWMLPSVIKAFVGADEAVEVIPESKDDVVAAAALRELLTFQFRKKMKSHNLIHDSVKTALVCAETYAKATWVEKDKVSGETVNRPEIVFVHPNSIRYDWATGSMYESHVVTHEEDLTRSQVMHMMTGAKGLVTEAFDQVMAADGSNNRTGRLIEQVTESDNTRGFVRDPSSKAADLFLRREQWTEYDMDKDGRVEPVLAVFINDVLVQVVHNPFDHKRPPFLWGQGIRDPYSASSMSIPEILDPIQRYQTGLMRLGVDNADSQLNGMFEVDSLNVDKTVFDLIRAGKPRTALPVRKPGSINPIRPAPLADQVFNLMELAASAGENRGGWTRFSQGLNAESLNQTATGFLGITQRSEQRLWEFTARFSDTFVKPMYRMMISLNQQFLTKADIELQFGPDSGTWVTLENTDIAGAFASVELDIRVGSDKDSLVSAYGNMLTTIAPFIGNGVPESVIQITVTEMAKQLGLKRVEFAMRQANGYRAARGISVPEEFIGDGGGDTPPGNAVGGSGAGGGGLPPNQQQVGGFEQDLSQSQVPGVG